MAITGTQGGQPTFTGHDLSAQSIAANTNGTFLSIFTREDNLFMSLQVLGAEFRSLWIINGAMARNRHLHL